MFFPQKCFITDRNNPQHTPSPSSDDPAGEKAVCGGPGYTWSMAVWTFGCTAKCSKTTLQVAYGREINIQLSGNSSVGNF
jgi:hypothetical protein